MGWDSVDTVRCERCAIYTPKSDLVFGADGLSYCLLCEPPPASRAHRGTDRAVPFAPYARVEVIGPAYRAVLQDHVRYIVGAILLVTLAFPIAACVSQL